MPLHQQLHHHHQLLQPPILRGVSGAYACQPQRCLPPLLLLPLLCQQEASPQPALHACATAASQVRRLQLLLLPG
jgi:hypothetical protein